MLKPIHKFRSDAAGNWRPRERDPETQGELKGRLRGIDLNEQADYLNFALPFLINDICKLTGLGVHKGAHEIKTSRNGMRCIQFHDKSFAHIFYSRLCSHDDDKGLTVVRWSIENENFRQINNKEPQLMMLKSAGSTIDVEAFEAAAGGTMFGRAALCG